jgi:signal transduction histidine kinase
VEEGSAYQPREEIRLSRDEQAVAAWVMAHGRMMGLYEDAPPAASEHVAQHVQVLHSAKGWVVPRSLRLLPLKLGPKVIGVLRLRVMETSRRFPDEERLGNAQDHPDTAVSFFWTFLEQVTALLERARLQRESVRMAVLQRTDALRPEKERCSLTGLIYEVLDRLTPLFEGRTVLTSLPADLLEVETDYLQIDQVLTNLLENAVRYTPEDSPIEVSACLEGSQVVLTVADRGPAIPPEDLERIFDKFYRVLQSRNPVEYPTGSGLGLAVCKGLVEAHGGHIWATLREGGGLIISVALPYSSPLKRGDQEEEVEV